tara:strand:+ start:94631 stop:94768 length:138 start_codon:yes stop_codon:yes gene_type:complete
VKTILKLFAGRRVVVITGYNTSFSSQEATAIGFPVPNWRREFGAG